MTTRNLVSLVTGVLMLAVIVPIALSIWLATSQATILFYSELDNYSSRVLMRIQQVASQAREALQEADAHSAAACSPQHLLAMRRIAYTHRYVQEVLWLKGSVPQCSSLKIAVPRSPFQPRPPHHRRLSGLAHYGQRSRSEAQNDGVRQSESCRDDRSRLIYRYHLARP